MRKFLMAFTLFIAIGAIDEKRPRGCMRGRIPLFTEEFGKDLSRNTQWAAFIKKNKIDDAPSFPKVLSFICDRMKPVWESLA